MNAAQGVGVWLLGAVGLYLAGTAIGLPDGFVLVLEGVWGLASALFALAVWRGDRRQ